MLIKCQCGGRTAAAAVSSAVATNMHRVACVRTYVRCNGALSRLGVHNLLNLTLCLFTHTPTHKHTHSHSHYITYARAHITKHKMRFLLTFTHLRPKLLLRAALLRIA